MLAIVSSVLIAANVDAQVARADSQAGATYLSRVWVFSDAHIGSDLRHGRESLGIPLGQSEGPEGFDCDIALNLGDFSGAQGTPKDEEGREVVSQYGALRKHKREDVYDISGNHDRRAQF